MTTSTSHIALPLPVPVHLAPGSGRLLLPFALLAVGADLLFRAPAAGLNLTLWVGALVGGWWFERGGAAAMRGRAEQALLLVALLLAADSLNLLKWQFPAGATIAANGFVKIWASGRNEVIGTNYHTNFTLKQTKNTPEYVLFSTSASVIVDHIAITEETQ